MRGMQANRSRVRPGVFCAALLATVCGTADAALPAVLDHVPADAAIVVAAPDLQKLLNEITAFNQAFGEALPQDVRNGLAGAALLQLIITQPGFNATGPAAVIVSPNAEDPQAEPAIVALLPIGDFKAFQAAPFIANQQPVMEGDTLSVNLMGTMVHMRDVGGFVAAGADKDIVAAFDGAKGRMDAHTARMGKAGDALASANDVTIITNVAALKPALEQGVAELGQQAQFLGAMGGGDAVGAQVEIFEQIATNFVRDGEVGLLGLDVGAAGIGVDLGANFKPGSELAGFFAEAGKTDGLLGKLPSMQDNGGYLAAYAIDASHPFMKRAMLEAGKGADAAANPLAVPAPLVEAANGFAGIMGVSSAMGGAGLLANMITYTSTDDPAKVIAAGKTLYEGIGKAAVPGMTIASTYESGVELKDHGLKVDTYTLKLQPDPDAADAMGGMVDPTMISQMFFGMSGGPSGYISAGNGGVYQTLSRNGMLLKQALAAGGDNAGFAAQERVQRVAGHMLANGRIAEAYVSIDGIASTVLPIAVMFGAVAQAPEVPAMDPIGVSASAGDGGMTLRTFLPGDVITFLAKTGAQLNGEAGAPGAAPAGGPEF